MTRFWNLVLAVAVRRATVWPSQHDTHGALLGDLKAMTAAGRRVTTAWDAWKSDIAYEDPYVELRESIEELREITE